MSDWRSDLCHALGRTANSRNLQALDLWARSEAQPTHLHNPLGAGEWNETRGEWFGEHFVTSYANVGFAVRDYTRLLRLDAFAGISLALGVPGDLDLVWEAINHSPWRARGYQSGYYPVLLYRTANAPILGIAPPVTPIATLAHDLFHSWHNLTHELHHHTPHQIARGRHFAGRMRSAVN